MARWYEVGNPADERAGSQISPAAGGNEVARAGESVSIRKIEIEASIALAAYLREALDQVTAR